MENQESSMPGDPGSQSEVRAHAPTLLGFDPPGEQGEVRVWAPNPWQRRADMTLMASTGVSMLSMFWITGLSFSVNSEFSRHIGALIGFILAEAFVGLIIVSISLMRMRRARYFTMDDAGIGITTLKGARALRWSQIRSARSVHYSTIALQTDSGPLKLVLQGYTEATAVDFFAAIVNRANLYRSPEDAHLFLPEEQVRERFMSRQSDAVLERPPMPSSQRYTNNAAAKRRFATAVALLVLFVSGMIAYSFWFRHRFRGLNFAIQHTFELRTGDPSYGPMFWEMDQLHGPEAPLHLRADQAASESFVPILSATIWLNQPAGAPLPIPDVPGYVIQSTTSMWAPIGWHGVRGSLYRYEINFSPVKVQRIWPPRNLVASLTDGSRRTFYRMHDEFPQFETTPFDLPSFINSETSALKENRPVIGSLPSPRSWRYVGVAASDTREISGFEFKPAPTSEDFEPATGKQLAAAVAAWLPGRFTGDRLICDIIYRDGGVRHLDLAPGVQVKGLKVLWKMPAKLAKQLPQGPI